MTSFNVLLTGDYRHREFSDITANARLPITLQAFAEAVRSSSESTDYGLVVIAQSRRGQFHSRDVEELLDRFSGIPVALLLGSWCEGELRSGDPIPGMIRIYWHQWCGRFEHFMQQIVVRKMSSWHLPRICSIADRLIVDEIQPTPDDKALLVGISSSTKEGFQMLSDVCEYNCFRSKWIEQLNSSDLSAHRPDAILVESNSLTRAVAQRIEKLKTLFPRVPLALVMNFPRQQDRQLACRLGVGGLISKPFQLKDVGFALQRAIAAA